MYQHRLKYLVNFLVITMSFPETMRGLCLSERVQDVIVAAMQKFINSAILQEVALECLAALCAAGNSFLLSFKNKITNCLNFAEAKARILPSLREIHCVFFAAGGADVLNDSCALDRVADAMLHHASSPGIFPWYHKNITFQIIVIC